MQRSTVIGNHRSQTTQRARLLNLNKTLYGPEGQARSKVEPAPLEVGLKQERKSMKSLDSQSVQV